jgi:hypothetical protein
MPAPVNLDLLSKQYIGDRLRDAEQREFAKAAKEAKTGLGDRSLRTTIAADLGWAADAAKSAAKTIRSWFAGPPGAEPECC